MLKICAFGALMIGSCARLPNNLAQPVRKPARTFETLYGLDLRKALSAIDKVGLCGRRTRLEQNEPSDAHIRPFGIARIARIRCELPAPDHVLLYAYYADDDRIAELRGHLVGIDLQVSETESDWSNFVARFQDTVARLSPARDGWMQNAEQLQLCRDTCDEVVIFVMRDESAGGGSVELRFLRQLHQIGHRLWQR
jgi:hypothetical protein